MSSSPTHPITHDAYLALERIAEYKNEYIAGRIIPMQSSAKRHSLIGANVIATIGNQIQNRSSRVYASRLKVMVEATGLITYPDVSVACEEDRFYDSEEDVLLNPTLIVEVLSPSTELYDRGTKTEHYRKIASLQEYVLIAQDRIHIERFSRNAAGHWTLVEVDQPGQVLRLDSIDCNLAVDDVYAKVQFGPEPESTA
jgi:Uma2 family endonuclease